MNLRSDCDKVEELRTIKSMNFSIMIIDKTLEKENKPQQLC